MLKKIALTLAAVLVLVLAYAAVQSPDYVISREITINSTPEKIFPYLNNSKLAESWSPWMELDPQAKMTYSGPDAGPGSKASWDSEGKLGVGGATIIESVPNERVDLKLEYTKPFEMTQDAQYAIRSDADRSVVSWSVRGKNNFIGRIMCIFMDMDKMVGANFEKGLANLKAKVEANL